jgi:hypothetical protein
VTDDAPADDEDEPFTEAKLEEFEELLTGGFTSTPPSRRSRRPW